MNSLKINGKGFRDFKNANREFTRKAKRSTT